MLGEKWHRTLAALAFAQLITMMAFSFVFPFFPLYIQSLGIRGTVEAAQWAGAIVAATAISMAISQPIWGNLADRWGRKPMVLRSMLGGSVTLILMGMVLSVEQLLILRFIQGAVTGTVAAGNALVAASVPRQRLGSALGIMQVAFFLGTSVGPLIGGVVADGWGYRAPFYAAGAMMLVSFLIVLVFVQESFVRPPAGEVRPSLLAQSRTLMGVSIFPILIGVMFLIQLGNIIITPVLALFVSDLNSGQNPATASGIVLAGTGVVSAVSALVLGRLGDRVGHRVILPICLIGASVTYFPQALVQQVWQLLLLRMALGIFLGGLMPSANALIARIVPGERRGAAFGLGAAATAMANAVGPLAGAAIATQWDIRTIFVVTGFLFALAYLWVTAGFRRHPVTRSQPREPASPVGRPEARSPDVPLQPEDAIPRR